MSELVLITDRTADDVKKIKDLMQKGVSKMTLEELSEWLTGMKGSYNALDLNRVGEAVLYVTERLKLAGWHIEPVVKTNWLITDFPTTSEMQRYLDNIKLLRSALPTGLPDVPVDMNKLTYEEANIIERILVMLDESVTNIMQNVYYSNEIYSGEV